MLKETWEGKEKSLESVVSHILTMRDRMDVIKELVRENMEKAQSIQKWYNQNAFGEQLNVQQREKLAGLLKEFRAVFSNLLERTRLAEHPIKCGSAKPIRLAPYQIPHAYRKAVQQQEIRKMLEGSIIEPHRVSGVRPW